MRSNGPGSLRGTLPAAGEVGAPWPSGGLGPGSEVVLRTPPTLNRTADVAKVGMDQHDSVSLLYQVPPLTTASLRFAQAQFETLAAGVATAGRSA